ncbi:MAG: hypothetical protein L7T26_04610 [Pseudomonadales bacterium]|nr:hypothetical protein [Pseudomonadales bacterium]
MNSLRKSLTPKDGDTWLSIAERALPELDAETGVNHLQSWNLHIFARRTLGDNDQPTNPILPSDIVFLEPPAPKSSGE